MFPWHPAPVLLHKIRNLSVCLSVLAPDYGFCKDKNHAHFCAYSPSNLFSLTFLSKEFSRIEENVSLLHYDGMRTGQAQDIETWHLPILSGLMFG